MLGWADPNENVKIVRFVGIPGKRTPQISSVYENVGLFQRAGLYKKQVLAERVGGAQENVKMWLCGCGCWLFTGWFEVSLRRSNGMHTPGEGGTWRVTQTFEKRNAMAGFQIVSHGLAVHLQAREVWPYNFTLCALQGRWATGNESDTWGRCSWEILTIFLFLFKKCVWLPRNVSSLIPRGNVA